VSERLLRRLAGTRDWQSDRRLGADNYSDGETLGAFTSYVPIHRARYGCIQDVDHFFVWGIKPQRTSGGMIELEFHTPAAGRPMSSVTSAYGFPRLAVQFRAMPALIDAPSETCRSSVLCLQPPSKSPIGFSRTPAC
jgi:hypothetical protein